MDLNKHSGGFTFISIMFTLSIIILLLPLISYFIQSISFTSNYHELAVYQFFYFVRDDLIEADDYDIRNNKIILQLPSDEEATISQYKQLVRRQVDNQGHEVYLREIENMHINQLSFGFQITIMTEEGDIYEKLFTNYEK